MDASDPPAAPDAPAEPSARHPLLQAGPLYALSLPRQLLDALEPRTFGVQAAEPVAGPSSERPFADAASTSVACAACGVAAFDTAAEHRAHARTDWHRYNIRLKLRGSAPVSEAQFASLVDSAWSTSANPTDRQALDDNESLSGTEESDASSEASGGSSDGAVSKLLRKAEFGDGANGAAEDEAPRAGPRSPVVWFTADAVPSTQFGIYRAIVPSVSSDPKARTEPPNGWQRALADLQVVPLVPKPSKKTAAAASSIVSPFAALGEGAEPTEPSSRTWTMLMVGGGHFAGMVVSLVPKITRGPGGRLERDVSVFAHKTYHRYTTRRKQGGGQSANDNAKGNAKSAGAQIRRYNESALRDDIRGLLGEWRELVDASELVFIRSSRSNMRIFTDYENSTLAKGDSRIRSFPFPTRRPTLAELTRCFNELTRVKLSYLTADELAALDADYLASIQPKPAPVAPAPAEPKAPAAPKLSAEELQLRDRWERVLDMARRGRVDALVSFVARHAEPTDPDWCGRLPNWLVADAVGPNRATPTLLHAASLADQAEVVRWLLFDRHVDPTLVAEDGASRTAYELAPSRPTRNVFRRCMAERPDAFDWTGAARVPSALSEEQEAEQRDKGKDRKARMRDQIRARDRERATEDAARETEEARLAAEAEADRQRRIAAAESARGGPRKLGGAGAVSSRTVAAAQAAAGLSDAQRAAIERERRARAAEARLQR